jgi:hypothetical protein|tara:strand:+ start:1471 stop:2376 length:906 start_codon:yes stop_codon:yes gene_type:complete
MANTTFNGSVRSENGFKQVTKSSTLGTFTDNFTVNSSGAVYGTAGAHFKYTAAAGYGPADLVVGKGGSIGGTVNPYAESSTALFQTGTKLFYGNNIYRYGQCGGTAVTAGKLVQHAAIDSNHANMTATAAVSAGETDISVETGGNDMTLNEYANGYLWVNDVNGEGQTMRVKSNPAHDHSADPSVVITTYDALATALTTSSQLSIIHDPYTGLIVAPATETGCVMGATVIDMTADYYGWFTVSGPQALLTVGTVVVGNIAVRSGGTAGGVAPATDNVLTEIGEVMAVSANTEYSLVWMNIQ